MCPFSGGKVGEIRAIGKLGADCRARITPLFEMTEDSRGGPETLARELVGTWGMSPFFFSPGERLDLGLLVHVIERAVREYGGVLVPVLGTNDPLTYREHVARTIRPSNGFCLRVSAPDLFESEFQSRLEQLLSDLSVTTRLVHCLIDAGVVTETGIPYNQIYGSLPHVREWASLTVTGGAFPVNLTAFEVGIHRQPRHEWLSWKQNVKAFDRTPGFGDYATLHPKLSGYFKGMNPSASTSVRL